MIVSNKFLRANYGRNIRSRVTRKAAVARIVDLAGLPVFKAATVRTIVLITTNGAKQDTALYSPPPSHELFLGIESASKSLHSVADPLAYRVSKEQLGHEGWTLIRDDEHALMQRLKTSAVALQQHVNGRICMGIKSGLIEAFVISNETRKRLVRESRDSAQIIKPFIQGRNIRRYHIEPSDQFLIYTPHGINMRKYPAVLRYLKSFKDRLDERATKQEWYELQQPQARYERFFEQPKIVFPDIATTCRFALDTHGFFGANTVYFIPEPDPCLLGLLNSRVAEFYFRKTCAALEGPGESYLRFFGQYLEGFPVRLPTGADQKRLSTLVEAATQSSNNLTTARTPQQRAILERQAAATDAQIDRLVYQLYDLTDEEIQIVEQAAAPSTPVADSADANGDE